MVVDDELGRVPGRVQKRNFGRPQNHVVQVQVGPLPALTLLRSVALTVTRMTSERKPRTEMVAAVLAEVARVLLLPFPPPQKRLLTSVSGRFPERILTNFRRFFDRPVWPVRAGRPVLHQIFDATVLVRLPAMMAATLRLWTE